MHVFVCSNSWLDVGYGASLQEYLLDNANPIAIYESAVERQFSTADINTIISIIGRARVGDEAATRFVSLRGEFEAALTEPSLRREVTRTRAELFSDGIRDKRYVGDKWGGKFLRGPDIYHQILAKCSERLVALGDIAAVKYGIKTGANDFFYLTQTRIDDWGIEAEFRRPVMTTPQESRSLSIDPATLPHELFMCHKERKLLRGTGALAYIEWGEKEGYHQRSSTASRARWYDLGARETTKTATNLLVGTTARTFLVDSGILFTHNFITIYGDSSKALPSQMCAAMNSTLAQLFLNLAGRVNFGQGVLEVQTYELEKLMIPDPSLLPVLPAPSIFGTESWDVLEPSKERRQIDTAVFDALGLTDGERDSVYEAVHELIRNRQRRARSKPATLR